MLRRRAEGGCLNTGKAYNLLLFAYVAIRVPDTVSSDVIPNSTFCSDRAAGREVPAVLFICLPSVDVPLHVGVSFWGPPGLP